MDLVQLWVDAEVKAETLPDFPDVASGGGGCSNDAIAGLSLCSAEVAVESIAVRGLAKRQECVCG